MKHSNIRTIIKSCILSAGIFLFPCFRLSTSQPPIDHPSSILVFDDGKQLAIASDKGNTIAIIPLPVRDGHVWKQIQLPGKPSGMVAARDGKTLYVTCGEEQGMLLAIDPASTSVTHKFAAGHCPLSPILNTTGDRLYFCRRFTHEIVSINLTENTIQQSIPVKSEPVALALLPAAKPLLLVAHHRPYGSSVAEAVASSVSVIDITRNAVVKEISLPNGSTNIFHLALSPDGKYAYVPHTLGRYLTPTTQVDRGWMNTNALSVIDVEKQALINTILLDDLDLGATNPYDLSVTEDKIIVTHAGSHELSVIDRAQLHRKLESVKDNKSPAGYTAQDVSEDLSFLADLRVRIPLKGNGPRSVSRFGTQVYVAGYFSNSVEILQLDNNRVASVIQSDCELTKAERGEMLFHDGRVCFQQWQSCASCHPDARTDGLNWDLLNDGMGNPKNTKSLLFSHATPPTTITGIRPNAEHSVRSGILHIQFVERPNEDAACMDEYLKALRPIKSPYLVNGDLSKAAKRGKKIFETAGCAACHSGAYLTDMQLHPVGATADYPKDQRFDTPTLIEVWRTPPFLYDGRAETLKDMMTTFNDGDRHGITHQLSEKQLNDLAEYVLSL